MMNSSISEPTKKRVEDSLTIQYGIIDASRDLSNLDKEN